MARIIARYVGICSRCGETIEPGKDFYDLDTKKALHAKCVFTEPLLDRALADEIADRLGFIRWDPVGLEPETFVRWKEWKCDYS